MRTYKLVASLTAAALLSIAAPASTSAVTVVDVSAQDVTVRYNDCKTSEVEVTGDWDTDVYNEIRIVVRSPGGRWFDEKTVYDDYDGYVRMGVRLCDGDRAGDYRVKATAIGFDEAFEEVSRVDTETTFNYNYIPKKKSRIRHRVIHRPNQPRYKYDVPGQLLRNGHGFKGVRVLLIVRLSGGWYKVDAMRTQRRGFFGWRFEPNGLRWRYYYRGNRSTKPSVTDIFRTPRRSSAGTTARVTTANPTLDEAKAMVRKPS